ncbi:peptide ABC transporter substrate-binding protein [Bacillus cytotoxicus]|uniref:Oligopeptide transporter, periplasmic-binding protein n=1 Tax=Bacillus cytotoxicus TaxID=580165 RepID=A0AAX2CFG0_9BACI|nr:MULTISPECIES: peptide ABC transporter substrate-binding protein [Bacillus cereus group]QTR77642.1 peptide ABC transporter substrate-binding protein [Bacillus cytotoxicus]QTR82539.1 peptide ABC transporter substrate-binding protein [Bacillus cytotoxicus]QTR86277.1 peptide ABC transporter substrate-binding protein [Bacillus cytotoxicus]SCL89760.1 Oligopeptide transporter, periplasmic-binding protein [Bacillus cytotoxicus]HDR4571605.1 peptide ABC transporter substrate-binding protein [Bacillus
MKKKTKRVAALSLTLSLVLTACGQKQETTTNKDEKKVATKQILNIVETGEISTLDSSIATDGFSYAALNNVMEGLYMPGPGNKPVPGAAESYTLSEDGKTYIFKLRHSNWSNGDPVTAHDFEYAWKRAINPETASEYAHIMFDIKNAEKVNKKALPLDSFGVKALDDKTLEVQLEHPVPYFLGLMGFATFYPQNQKVVEAQGTNYGLEAANAVYNGPFVLNEWKHDTSYKMTKNPNYWDHKNVKLQEINVNIVKDTSAAVNLFESKQVDRITINSEFVDKYQNDPSLKKMARPSVTFFRFNQKNPLLANKNARKAISLSFDKKGITTTILNNGSIPANAFIPKGFVKGPDNKDFRSTSNVKVETNIKEAKKQWETAKKETNLQNVSLSIISTDESNDKKISEYLKGELEKNLPGLKITLNPLPVKAFLEREGNGDFEISLSTWGPDYPDPTTFLNMFVTDGPFNKMNYSNKQYDELMEKASSSLTTDLPARWKAFQDAEKILVEDDAAIAPIFQAGLIYLERPSVKGVVVRPFAGIYSYKWAYITE